jgi:hypothetical protein
LVDGDPCDPKRTKKEGIGVSLALIDPEADPEERRLLQQIEGCIATSTIALFNHYTSQELINEIKYCNDILTSPQYKKKKIKQGNEKMDRAVNFKRARKALSDVKGNWKEERKEFLCKKLEDYIATKKNELKERMEHALKLPFYSFEGTAALDGYATSDIDTMPPPPTSPEEHECTQESMFSADSQSTVGLSNLDIEGEWQSKFPNVISNLLVVLVFLYNDVVTVFLNCINIERAVLWSSTVVVVRLDVFINRFLERARVISPLSKELHKFKLIRFRAFL